MSHLKRFDNNIRRERGVDLIGGIDEAGRGALAGPVVAGVVVLPGAAKLGKVNDSKTLKPEQREAMVAPILERAASAALGMATAAEVDRWNVLEATHLAVRRALHALPAPAEFFVTDYLQLKTSPCPWLAVTDGDARSLAVAAASVLAKVARDRIMTLLEDEYPQYGMARHKGYGVPAHWSALDAHGPSTIHRLSYKGVGWFDAEPAVRSRSLLARRLPPKPPAADLMSLLSVGATAADPRPYLPEVEYRWANGA